MARSPLRSKLFPLLERAVEVHEELSTCTRLSAKKRVRITDRKSEWKAQETGHGDCRFDTRFQLGIAESDTVT